VTNLSHNLKAETGTLLHFGQEDKHLCSTISRETGLELQIICGQLQTEDFNQNFWSKFKTRVETHLQKEKAQIQQRENISKCNDNTTKHGSGFF